MDIFGKDRLVATVFLNIIRDNYLAVMRALPDGCKVCAVVKADAYGHGDVRIAELYERLGASYLAVASPEEALSLRRSGIRIPILVLGYTPPSYIESMVACGITLTVYSTEYALMLDAILKSLGIVLKIHLKIDSGMSRLGFRMNELPSALETLRSESFIIEGIYTHLSCADGTDTESVEFTKHQIGTFLECVDFLDFHGIHIPIRHVANSAAIASDTALYFEMVRPGIILYGYQMVESRIHTAPALEVKTVISDIRELERGESVGYGRAFIADKKMRIATLPIGYADGIPRCAAERGLRFFVNEFPARIIGRVCMDQLMIDVTDAPFVKLFDEALVFGKEGGRTAENMARTFGTIPYEILTGVSRRAKRIYVNQKTER